MRHRGERRHSRRELAAFFGVALAILAALVLVRGADPPPVAALREAWFDLLQRRWPRPWEPLPVRVVDIDERSLAEVGQWPWPRDLLAELSDRLADQGAAVIAYDILFSEPDRMSPARILADPKLAEMLGPAAKQAPDTDALFAAALARLPSVLSVAETAQGPPPPAARAGVVLVGTAPGARLPVMTGATHLIPELAEAAAGIGSVSVSPFGGSGTAREVPLFWRTPDGFLPSLALEALRLALGETTYVLKAAPSGGGLGSVRLGGYEVPTSPEGMLRVRYRLDSPELYISASDVLSGAVPRAAVEGHVVFVGTSAAGLLDVWKTPLGEQVPGVSVHAQILEQILLGTFLERSDLTGGVEIAVVVVLGLLVTLVLAFSGPALSLAAGGLAAAGILAWSWVAFMTQGQLFDATFPLVGGFVAFSGLTLFQFFVADRERRQIRRSFARYVAPEVLDEIERQGHRLQLGGEVREATVLFCDVRGFTRLSERLSPRELVSLLNALFTDLGQEVLVAGGTIDKFIGDALMAFWNAPIDVAHHELIACRAALRMRVALETLNARRAEAGKPPIGVAIGLSTGIVCAGNIGSNARFNYTLVGGSVNVASRIEHACRAVGCDILVSDTTARAAPELAFLDAGWLALEGTSGRTRAWVLAGGAEVAGSSQFRELEAALAALCDHLRRDCPLSQEQVAAFRSAVEALHPALGGFAARLPLRAGDYMEPDAADQVAPAR